MDRIELDKIASYVLEEDVLAGLKEWYVDTLEAGWIYVVFIVRRSYILALIMEILTGKMMKASEAVHYLTDASMLLHCEELAEAYRRDRRIPTILLCDDVCIHGRNINHFIGMIERRLIFLLPEYDEADIREALLEALRIHVYARSEGPLLLNGKYEFNLSYKRKGTARFIHGFSSDIALLILLSGISNASYIYSESVPQEKVKSMELTDYIDTSYQNVRQHTHIEFIGDDRAKKAVYTLRIIEHSEGQWNILPFVFMPNLGEDETVKLLWVIQRRMQSRGMPEKYITRLDELEQIPGKRTFNEIITLLFSHVLLQEFNRKYGIAVQETDHKAQIIKLARNYDRYGFEDAEEWIDTILSEQLFTPGEVAHILESVVMPERRMICINPGNKAVLSRTDKTRIKEKVEKYFYLRGCEEEKEAYELSRKPYAHERPRNSRTVRGCGFLMCELNDGYTELEAEYSIACFLQMMDAGAVCLSSFAPNEMSVVGLAQFAKTGEQSLMSEALKFYEWIPMLSMMEEECGGNESEFYIELEKYGKHPRCGFTREKLGEFEDFAEKIYDMGHRIQDWNNLSISYLYKLEIDLPGMDGLSQHKKMSKFLDLQIQHITDYKKYRRYGWN